MDKKIEPRGIRNNNPLNIRKGSNWQGEKRPQTDAEFEQFESMQYGVRAGFKILKQYMSGYNGLTERFNTIEKIVRRWAPPSENNTRAYIEQVSKLTGIPPTLKISFTQRSYMVAIVDAMIRHECGQAIDQQIIESAYDMV
jgi:hypothetical protein